MTDTQLAVSAVLSWAAVGGTGAVALALTRSNGRKLAAFERMSNVLASVESRAGASTTMPPLTVGAAGLDPGTPAPEFRLRDMRNRERGLADYRGRKILLVFFSLECEHSRALAPELGLLPKGAPQLVVLSRGDPAEHRKLARENEWTADVLLEEGLEISVRYQSIGTPGAYVIAEDGRIASVLALGGEAVLGIALEATPAA